MTIQECYQKMGADYEDVLKRLYSESMIRKFAGCFWTMTVIQSWRTLSRKKM